MEHHDKRALGEAGEKLACEHLKQAGLIIIDKNYRTPQGEVDIIARDGDTVVFIEVRTRRSGFRGYAEESIRPHKLQRLQKIAQYYLCSQGYTAWPRLRFDLVALLWQDSEVEVKWIKGMT